MFQSPILDVAVGLVLFFLVLSLVCTSLNEMVAQVLSLREELLWRTLCSLFQNSDGHQAEIIAGKILDHNLVDSMSPAGKNPSYIPSHVFSLAILDVIGIDGIDTKEHLPTRLESAMRAKQVELGENIFETLKPLAISANNSIDVFRQNIETWFNDMMDQASGWYKRRVRVITFCVAFCVCLMLNADSMMLAKALWTSPQAAAKLASTAQTVSKLKPPTDVSQSSGEATNQVSESAAERELRFPSEAKLLPPELQGARSEVFGLIGWSGHFSWQVGYDRTNEHRYPADPWDWLLKLFGLLVTTIAACLGAPFWFDILKKAISLRNAGNANSTEKQTRIASDDKVKDAKNEKI